MFFVLFLFWLHQYFSFLQSTIAAEAAKLPNQVKVRDYDSEEDDHKRSSFKFFGDFHSLSLYDCCSPVKKKHYVFPTTVVRIPESCFLPKTIIPTVSVSEGEAKNDTINEEDNKPSMRANTKDEDDRQNIRAGTIPRPRAVISSPDNDEIIGNRNKMKGERSRAVKKQSQVQNRHANAECKTSPIHVTTESAINTRKSKEASDTKSGSKVRKRSVVAGSGQRAHRKEWET